MNNGAAIGYMISAMKRAGYDREAIQQIHDEMEDIMDMWLDEDQAEKVYQNF